MWKEIFSFEVRYHLRQPLFYITGLALFLLALLFASTGMGARFDGLPGIVDHNAPIVILRLMAGLTVLGLFVVSIVWRERPQGLGHGDKVHGLAVREQAALLERANEHVCEQARDPREHADRYDRHSDEDECPA